jgi:hypothetical protein
MCGLAASKLPQFVERTVRQRLACSRALMSKVARSGEIQGDARFDRRCGHLLVAHRASRMHYRGHPGGGQRLESVGEREEAKAGQSNRLPDLLRRSFEPTATVDAQTG